MLGRLQTGGEEDVLGRAVLREGQQGAWVGPGGAGEGAFPGACLEDSELKRGFSGILA